MLSAFTCCEGLVPGAHHRARLKFLQRDVQVDRQQDVVFGGYCTPLYSPNAAVVREVTYKLDEVGLVHVTHSSDIAVERQARQSCQRARPLVERKLLEHEEEAREKHGVLSRGDVLH